MPKNEQKFIDSLLDEVDFLFGRNTHLEKEVKMAWKDGLACGGLLVGMFLGILWALVTF